MSHFEQRIRRELNAQIDARPPLARMLARQRQNFGMKILALATSILLYFYVQAERNPILQRPFRAAVIAQDVPPDVEVELEKPNVLVSISGPTDIIERISDRDVRAVAFLSDAARDSTKMQNVRARFEVSGLDKETAAKLTFDPAEPTVKAQLFASATRQLALRAIYPRDAPAGYDYGLPDLKPSSVKVIGRSDRVNRVDQLIVEAAPTEAGAHIEGEFPVVARDRQDNPVQGVKIEPPTVRLSVPLVEKPPSRIVTVSAITSGLPLPPYSLAKITVIPGQVRITGRQDALASTSTIETEIIPVGEMTQTQEFVAHLILPGNVTLSDMTTNRRIDTVKVRVEIEKTPVPTLPKAPATPAPASGTKTKIGRNSGEKTENRKQKTEENTLLANFAILLLIS